jgi:hypothetical protein
LAQNTYESSAFKLPQNPGQGSEMIFPLPPPKRNIKKRSLSASESISRPRTAYALSLSGNAITI